MNPDVNNKNNIKYNENSGKWIIDTDPGVDDAFAISLGLNLVKDNLVHLSIESGNVGLDQCEINARKLCVLSKRIVPISKGTKYTLSTLSLKCFPGIHGEDGFFDFKEYDKIVEDYPKEKLSKNYSAVEIIKLSHEYKNELNILAIGPLTNIALAYMLDPSIVNRIKRLVIMGGSYSDFGNIKPSGEFNFACDDVAAKVVFDNFTPDVYCWEPSCTNTIQLENITEENSSEKFGFFKKCVNKKFLNKDQGGVFADYGASVGAFFPESINKKRDLYCDIIIDSDYRKNSASIVSKNNIFNNKNKKKLLFMVDIDRKYLFGCLNKMLEDN